MHRSFGFFTFRKIKLLQKFFHILLSYPKICPHYSFYSNSNQNTKLIDTFSYTRALNYGLINSKGSQWINGSKASHMAQYISHYLYDKYQGLSQSFGHSKNSETNSRLV